MAELNSNRCSLELEFSNCQRDLLAQFIFKFHTNRNFEFHFCPCPSSITKAENSRFCQNLTLKVGVLLLVLGVLPLVLNVSLERLEALSDDIYPPSVSESSCWPMKN